MGTGPAAAPFRFAGLFDASGKRVDRGVVEQNPERQVDLESVRSLDIMRVAISECPPSSKKLS